MEKPLLQIALDQISLNDAITTAQRVESYVDIIEVGTILAFSEGMNAVKKLRNNHPNHTLVCDMKITDGGEILAKMAFDSGTNWLTVSAAAHKATIAACKKIADEFKQEIQIELYGNWTLDDAKAWKDLGIEQVIYHRSRDAELAGVRWTNYDIEQMKNLSKIGLKPSITGGIIPEDVHLFSAINAKAFIAGRALAGENGQQIAEALKKEINQYW